MQAYDRVPYRSVALPQTHPDRLATHARLFGLEPAPVTACRVLEVGCGDGGNLLPMAALLPESTFVGIDVAERPIAASRERAEAWGIRNVDLRALDLLDLPDELGTFDYILAHGVYSWVPDAVRDGLLRLLGAHLAPQGVAFVSYNALPGGHLRRLSREMMLYHAGGIEDPAKRVEQSRALLDFLVDAQPEGSAYHAVLEEERAMTTRYTDEHFFHDHIAEFNRAFYFHEFVAHAERHGLRYLAEADFAAMQDRTFPPETRAVLDRIDDPIRREQVLDFLRNRMLRQTLLCRADATVQRVPQPDRVRGLAVAAPVRARERDEASGVVTFEGAKGKAVRTGHPFAAAVCESIGGAWPCAHTFGGLWEAVAEYGGEDMTPDVLAQVLLDFYADGFVRLHTHAPPLAGEAPERPEALPVARRQAEDGTLVTNGWHRTVALDSSERRLLLLLNGRRDRSTLLNAWKASVEDGEPPTDDELSATLHRLARHALLIEQHP